MNGQHQEGVGKPRQKIRVSVSHLKMGHEQITLLTLALACYKSTSHLNIHLASDWRDKNEGTDFVIFLNVTEEDVIELSEEKIGELLWRVETRHDRRIDALRVDATTSQISWKIDKNKEHRERDSHSIWTWSVNFPFGDETTIVRMMDEHRRLLGSEHFERLEHLAAAGAVRFSPTDICPKHGEDCELVEMLKLVAGLMIAKLPVGKKRYHTNWQRLFRSTN